MKCICMLKYQVSLSLYWFNNYVWLSSDLEMSPLKMCGFMRYTNMPNIKSLQHFLSWAKSSLQQHMLLSPDLTSCSLFYLSWTTSSLQQTLTVHFIKVCQSIFGDNFLITFWLLVLSNWTFHNVCQPFFVVRNRFSWIRQKTKNFSIYPHCKNRLLW